MPTNNCTVRVKTCIFPYAILPAISRNGLRHKAFLLPGSVQQMDFCVNGKGSASSLRRSIDTKIHLLFLAPKQKSLIVNAKFIPLIFYSTGFPFP